MDLRDPELVRREYANDDRLGVRMSVHRETVEGRNALQLLMETIAEGSARRVLEVGCGTGELAERMIEDLGLAVVAVDLSPGMVQLARERGVDARVGDAQELPFGADEFDCVVAAWMLYHVNDLDRGLAELSRVLRPTGRLVAATFGEDNMRELWDVIGPEARAAAGDASFTRENGRDPLLRHFTYVERRDADGFVLFPDYEGARDYVAASIRRRHLVDRLPRFEGPLRVGSRHSVFIATGPL